MEDKQLSLNYSTKEGNKIFHQNGMFQKQLEYTN